MNQRLTSHWHNPKRTIRMKKLPWNFVKIPSDMAMENGELSLENRIELDQPEGLSIEADWRDPPLLTASKHRCCLKSP